MGYYVNDQNPDQISRIERKDFFAAALSNWHSQRLFLACQDIANQRPDLSLSGIPHFEAATELSFYFNEYQCARMVPGTALDKLTIFKSADINKLCRVYSQSLIDPEKIMAVVIETLDYNSKDPDHLVTVASLRTPEMDLRRPAIKDLYAAVKSAFKTPQAFIAEETEFWENQLKECPRIETEHNELIAAIPDLREKIMLLRIIAASRILTSKSAAEAIFKYKK